MDIGKEHFGDFVDNTKYHKSLLFFQRLQKYYDILNGMNVEKEHFGDFLNNATCHKSL